MSANEDHELRDRNPNGESFEVPEKRFTLRLAPAAAETLDWIVKHRGGVSYGEAIRRALGTERFLMERIERGAAVVIEEPGVRPKELVLRG